MLAAARVAGLDWAGQGRAGLDWAGLALPSSLQEAQVSQPSSCLPFLPLLSLAVTLALLTRYRPAHRDKIQGSEVTCKSSVPTAHLGRCDTGLRSS